MNVEQSVHLTGFLQSIGLPTVLAKYIERYGPKELCPENLTCDDVRDTVDRMQESEIVELADAMGFHDVQKTNADALRADVERRLLLDFSFAVSR